MSPMNSRYDVLGVKTDASQDEIKKAYRKLAAVTHPDRGGEVTAPLFRAVQDAYETLSDPLKRAAYDRDLEGPAPRREQTQRQEPESYDEYVYTEPASPAEPPAPLTRRQHFIRIVKIALIAAPVAWAVGAWILNVIGLWQLVQPHIGLHLVVFQGMPALVYIILWAVSTLVAATSDDLGPAISFPIIAAGITSVFAFITAIGGRDEWIPALVAGFVATAVVSLAVRFREGIAGWVR